MDRDASDQNKGANPKNRKDIAASEPSGEAAVLYLTGQESVPGQVPSPFMGGHAEQE